jgi:hypothetical protein
MGFAGDISLVERVQLNICPKNHPDTSEGNRIRTNFAFKCNNILIMNFILEKGSNCSLKWKKRPGGVYRFIRIISHQSSTRKTKHYRRNISDYPFQSYIIPYLWSMNSIRLHK